MRRLRVGLVGAGLVGQSEHAFYLWEERERFDFVALADPSPDGPGGGRRTATQSPSCTPISTAFSAAGSMRW